MSTDNPNQIEQLKEITEKFYQLELEQAAKARREKKVVVNPHNFPMFETDGYVTYSYNQAAHDAKLAHYLKSLKKHGKERPVVSTSIDGKPGDTV